MNCPDCDAINLKIDFKAGVVDCSVCYYHDNIGTLGEALGFLKDEGGKSWHFSRQDDRENFICVGDHTVGKVCFSEDGSIRLKVFESDVAWRLVDFFRQVFEEKTIIKVHTTCVDPNLECPVCMHSCDYLLKDNVVICGHCKLFSTSVNVYLMSCLGNAGYLVQSQPSDAFMIYTKKWILDHPLARFERREEIFTLRPSDDRTSSFEKLRIFIESLKLTSKLVILKRI